MSKKKSLTIKINIKYDYCREFATEDVIWIGVRT